VNDVERASARHGICRSAYVGVEVLAQLNNEQASVVLVEIGYYVGV